MNCLRCGRETHEDHVFCDSCREEMEKYPVLPGTAVMLPRKRDDAPAKKTKRHTHAAPSMEEQIHKLKRQKLWLSIVTFLLAAMMIVSAVFMYLHWSKQQYRPGQNYSAVETTAPQVTQ